MAEAAAAVKSVMSDAALLALIAQYEKEALGSSVAAGATVGTTYYSSSKLLTTLEIDRFNALNFYYARPLGNEVEGSSTVVLPELRDTVEWIMPQLMRIFAAARTPCIFDPESEDDVDQAELETEAVRHVFMVENDGFFVIHDYCKDALLLRNGYIKVYLEERTKSTVERYSELTQEELVELLQDDKDEKIKVLEQREYQVDMPPGAVPQSQQPQPSPYGTLGQPEQPQPNPYALPAPVQQPLTVFDVKLRRTKQVKRICVECAPPEEMLVSPKARLNLDGAPYICHKTTKARSDLILDGHDEDIVNAASPGAPRWLEMDALARDVVVDQMSVENPADKAM